MKRIEAINTILDYINAEDLVLSTAGMTSREIFDIKDRQSNFYMLGSMGLVSSIGLGLALNTTKRVFIFDGDGSILMDMGTMAVIGSQKPANLIHIVFDNQSYESTGGQPTVSNVAQLDKIAKASGYIYSTKVEALEKLNMVLKDIEDKKGPFFILIKTLEKTDYFPSRVRLAPLEIKERFMQYIKVLKQHA